MMQGEKRLLMFRVILGFIVIIGIEIVGYTAMWISSRSFDIASNKNYFQIRAMLIGDNDPNHLPRYLSLPYLGYIPFPGYKKNGILQNNEDGYRGLRVPFAKTDKLRILCLGGSTTYGFAVDSPSQAYPARLQSLLNQYISLDHPRDSNYRQVEVINAGLEAGTSAEELQQYLFKYRYYNPDIVIVHSGVNDAQVAAKSSSDFQLDYTHYRRLSFNLSVLSFPGRLLLRSYFISYITIRVFYDKFAYNGESGRECFERQRYQRFCKWSHLDLDAVVNKKEYEYYPFYHNTKSLFSSVIQDSALLVVFPNALNKRSEFVIANKDYNQINSLNATLSKSLTKDLGGIYISFDYDSIRDPSYWVDDCHVNAKGEQNKAEMVARIVMSWLEQKKK